MPITPTFPGVYIEEVPSGVRTITGVATSITAFVGYTPRGPINRAVRVPNFGDYERTFGGLRADSEVGYAVQQFFLNGGPVAYVVRVAKNAAAAEVTLKYGAGAGEYALVVSAASEGDWGNLVRMDVDYDTSNPDATFNLAVMRNELQGGRLVQVEREVHRNLSMNSRSATYAPSVVNAASRLVRLKRPAALAFDDRGYSLSGSLATFPTLRADETTITGVLDGVDPFTLVMAGGVPTGIAELIARTNEAIISAGLATRLQVGRADATGSDNAAGNFVKLVSLLVGDNPATVAEFSSVQATTAPVNDAARSLRLGLNNGGRERPGAASRRPWPTGTAGKGLVPGSIVSGQVAVTINDNSSGSAVAILPSTDLAPLANVPAGPLLRDALQALIRGIQHPAAQQAVVQLNGTFLRVVPSANTPNASILFSKAGSTAAGLGAGALVNVQQYSLGTGATFGAQADAKPGSNGSEPGASEIIGDYDDKLGIFALRDVDLFNLLAIPRTAQLADSQALAVLGTAIAFCTERRAFYLLDPNPSRDASNIADWVASVGTSKNAAVFFPRPLVADPVDGFRLKPMPASGIVAGVMARTDAERGVWKAPAGTDATLRGAQALSYNLTDQENGTLNPQGINCLRSLPVYGRVLWGARTMEGADRLASEWKYIPVRRTALFIEESLYRGTQWVVFEPNDEPLWSQIRLNVGAFMHNLFRQGAFQGRTPREAYLVKCDAETTTQNDIDLGIVNILVAFAPLKPAEFVIIKIQQLAGQIQT